MNILFLFLGAFSGHGGIEMFNRAFSMALGEIIPSKDAGFLACSVYDAEPDERYIPSDSFRGFGGKKLIFALYSIVFGFRASAIIIGHINLSLIGLVIKMINRDAKLVLIAHGIEVWSDLSWFGRSLIARADLILAVSNFTKEKLIAVHGIDPSKVEVFPNTLDPYFTIPNRFEKPEYLLERYNLLPTDKVALTVSRLSSVEMYKGYDKVIEALDLLTPAEHGIKYLICGRGDEEEIDRVSKMISRYNLEDSIFLIGEVSEDELCDHYLLSDVFVMPSKGEGFGIVYLEALVCGRPVIAGNTDGSVDAVIGGELGTLVNPDNLDELSAALLKIINGEIAQELIDPVRLQTVALDNFGYEGFKGRLRGMNALFPN